MALPSIMRKLFRNDGYGPLLKPEIIPFASDLASNGAEAATTEWVKSIPDVEIYLNPNGDDTNDGLSSSTAVKTFSKALELSRSFVANTVRLNVAPGTYNGGFTLKRSYPCVYVYLFGDVTINGQVLVYQNCLLFYTDESVGSVATLSVNATTFEFIQHSAFCAHSQGFVYVEANLNVSCGSSTVTYNNIVACLYGSVLLLNGNLTVSGFASHGISCWDNSTIKLNNVNFGNSGNISGVCVYITRGSVFVGDNITQTSIVKSGGFSVAGDSYLDATSFVAFGSVEVNACSVVRISTLSVSGAGNSLVEISHAAYINCGSLTITNTGTSAHAIGVYYNSSAVIRQYLKISGSYTGYITITASIGFFWLYSSATVVNNATGLRYAAGDLCKIQVDGGGANRLPGNAAGSVSQYYGIYR